MGGGGGEGGRGWRARTVPTDTSEFPKYIDPSSFLSRPRATCCADATKAAQKRDLTYLRHGNWPRIRGFPLEKKKCPPQKIKRSAQIRM